MENLKEKYDCIVVGAGPAGGSCARELAKKGHSVLIIDRAAEIGEPNYSTAGTPPETIKEFKLPKEVILKSWKNLQFRGPNGKFTNIKYDKIIGYTLDFRALKQFLVKEAIANKATTHIQTTATDLIKNSSGRIIGIKTKGTEGQEDYSADVVVDATGVEGKFTILLGLRKSVEILIGVGYEKLMANINLPDDGNTIYFGLGSKEAPKGYTWIFPIGTHEAKVGIGWIPVYHQEKLDIQEYFQKFIASYPGLSKGEEIENHCHSIPMIKDGKLLKHYSLDSFICIGDAAAQINPYGGEGIRHFLRSGKMAAQVISEAIKKKDFSQKQLVKYDILWKNYAQKKWKLCYYMHKFVYTAPDQLINDFLEVLSQMDKNQVLKMLWFYNKIAIGELLLRLAKKKTIDFKNKTLKIFG